VIIGKIQLILLFINTINLLTPLKSLAQSEVNISFDTPIINCLEHRLKEDVIIIESEEQYERLDMLRIRIDEDCLALPEIDFQKKILVGNRRSLTGCGQAKYKAIIKKIESNYVVQIAIQPDGVCRMMYREIFWFVFDKPRQDFEIKFESN
jgi:hypothetical protein